MNKLFTKEKLRVLLSLVLSFVLCLCIFFISFVSISFLATGKDFVTSSAKRSHYTEIAHSELIGELNDLAVPSGLPNNYFDDKLNLDEFEGLFYTCLANTVNGNKNFSLDYKNVEESILKNVTDFSINETGEITDNNQVSLQIFANECVKIYSTFVNPPLTNYLFSLFSPIRHYLLIAIAVLLVLGLTAGYTLFKINVVSPFKKYCFASFAGASLTLGIIPAILIATNEVSKLAITSKSLHAIITCFISDFLWLMVMLAIFLAIVSIRIITFKTKCLIFKK